MTQPVQTIDVLLAEHERAVDAVERARPGDDDHDGERGVEAGGPAQPVAVERQKWCAGPLPAFSGSRPTRRCRGQTPRLNAGS